MNECLDHPSSGQTIIRQEVDCLQCGARIVRFFYEAADQDYPEHQLCPKCAGAK